MKLEFTKNIVSFDIETDTENLDIILISVYSDYYQEYFLNLDDFFKFIVKKKITFLFAHYGGGFDFLLIFQKFLKNNRIYKLVNLLEINGLIIYFKINYLGFEFEFYDTFGLFRNSLETVSDNLIGEKKIDIDRKNLKDYSFDKIKDYCLNDSRLIYLSLKKFIEIIGFFEFTISKLALTYFKKKFLRHKLTKYNENQILEFQNFYYGGKTEVYKRYEQNINYYDVNSCYGYAMYQYGSICNYMYLTDKFEDNEHKKGLYVVNVLDKLDKPFIPTRFNNKTYFLNGNIDFNCTSIDLETLEKYKVRYKIKKGYIFEYDKEFFRDYVEYWYKKRIESKEIKFVSKLMINSLYGKFGQKIIRKSLVIPANKKVKYMNLKEYDAELGIFQAETKSIVWFSQPQIAAWITSVSRNVLESYIEKANFNIAYCDTDSIITTENLDAYVSNELGKLKLEGRYKEGYFLAPKFYILYNSESDKKIVLKGFEEKNLTKEFFDNALDNKFNYKYSISKILRYKSATKRFGESIKSIFQDKEIRNIELKRKLVDRIETIPFYLNNNTLT